MASTKQNMVIAQGTTFKVEFQLYDIDGNILTDTNGYTISATMRQSYEANNIYTFTTTITNGIVSLGMTANVTATIPPDNYYYIVDTSVANTTNRQIEGMITVTPRV